MLGSESVLQVLFPAMSPTTGAKLLVATGEETAQIMMVSCLKCDLVRTFQRSYPGFTHDSDTCAAAT